MSHNDLPRGCAHGIPVWASFAAVEIKAQDLVELGNSGVDTYMTYAKDTLFEMGQTMCFHRNVCLYDLIPKTSYTWTSRLHLDGIWQEVQFNDITLLHLAMKEDSIDIAMILLLLDPASINHEGICSHVGENKPVNPIEIASFYHSETSDMYTCMTAWKKLIDNGFFSFTTTCRERIKMFGLDRMNILPIMRVLGRQEWLDAFTIIVEQDMYAPLIALDNAIEGMYDVRLIRKNEDIRIPLALRPLFPNMSADQSIRIQNMNLLHYALMQGKYNAATALLVLCPEMAACTADIMGSNIRLPSCMFVKLFNNENSTATRMTCFRIMLIAEQSISRLEPLGLPTRRERVIAAGMNVGVLLHEWTRVGVGENITGQWYIPVSLYLQKKRSREEYS